MEPNKRRLVFIDCMNRNGFIGFVKHEQNSQTYYIFMYKETLRQYRSQTLSFEGKECQPKKV
ncbi:MAG: hypothetical protein GX799_09595 [Crenarchaeota archaeon]|jgi:hypothetical protein|nr:hypothetical protein [Thermoproteota archaeon]